MVYLYDLESMGTDGFKDCGGVSEQDTVIVFYKEDMNWDISASLMFFNNCKAKKEFLKIAKDGDSASVLCSIFGAYMGKKGWCHILSNNEVYSNLMKFWENQKDFIQGLLNSSETPKVTASPSSSSRKAGRPKKVTESKPVENTEKVEEKPEEKSEVKSEKALEIEAVKQAEEMGKIDETVRKIMGRSKSLYVFKESLKTTFGQQKALQLYEQYKNDFKFGIVK